jgi:MFS superfamily sulfate permease-like transporter
MHCAPPLAWHPLFVAAQLSTWEKLKAVPKDTWLNLGIVVLAVVIIVKAWRALKRLNDFAPYIAAAIAGSMILFFWVYERTEPRFLTPVIEPLTHFLPTKSASQEKLEKLRKAREEHKE